MEKMGLPLYYTRGDCIAEIPNVIHVSRWVPYAFGRALYRAMNASLVLGF